MFQWWAISKNRFRVLPKKLLSVLSIFVLLGLLGGMLYLDKIMFNQEESINPFLSFRYEPWRCSYALDDSVDAKLAKDLHKKLKDDCTYSMKENVTASVDSDTSLGLYFYKRGDTLGYELMMFETNLPDYNYFWDKVLGYEPPFDMLDMLRKSDQRSVFYRQRLNSLLLGESTTRDFVVRKTKTDENGVRIPWVFLLVMCFSGISSLLISDLIEDRQKKIKAGLIAIGVKRTSYYFGTFFAYFVLTLIQIAIIVGFYVAFSHFPMTTPLFITVLLLNGLYSILLSYVVSMYSQKTSAGSIIYSLLYFLLPFISTFMFSGPPSSSSAYYLFSLTPVAIELMFSTARDLPLSFDNLFTQNLKNVPSPGDMLMMFVLGSFLLLIWIICAELIEVYSNPFAVLFSLFFKDVTDYEEEMKKTVATEIEPHGEKSIPMLKLENVFQKYAGSSKFSLKNMNLEVFRNEIFCLLGHNGSGKSTTIGVLMGILKACYGKVLLNGKPLAAQSKESVGLCFQDDVMYSLLSAKQNLIFFGEVIGLNSSQIAQRIQFLTNELYIDFLNTKASLLSGGQKRKLCIAIAFIADPALVVLDEPTSGVDPLSRRQIWSFLRRQKANKCILFTTHFMDEADMLADRKAVLIDGHCKCVGSTLFMKKVFDVGYEVALKLNERESSSRLLALASDHGFGATLMKENESELKIKLVPKSSNDCEKSVAELLQVLEKDENIAQYDLIEGSLDQIFFNIQGDRNANKSNEIQKTQLIEDKVQVDQIEQNIKGGLPVLRQFYRFYKLVWFLFGKDLSGFLTLLMKCAGFLTIGYLLVYGATDRVSKPFKFDTELKNQLFHGSVRVQGQTFQFNERKTEIGVVLTSKIVAFENHPMFNHLALDLLFEKSAKYSKHGIKHIETEFVPLESNVNYFKIILELSNLVFCTMVMFFGAFQLMSGVASLIASDSKGVGKIMAAYGVDPVTFWLAIWFKTFVMTLPFFVLTIHMMVFAKNQMVSLAAEKLANVLTVRSISVTEVIAMFFNFFGFTAFVTRVLPSDSFVSNAFPRLAIVLYFVASLSLVEQAFKAVQVINYIFPIIRIVAFARLEAITTEIVLIGFAYFALVILIDFWYLVVPVKANQDPIALGEDADVTIEREQVVSGKSAGVLKVNRIKKMFGKNGVQDLSFDVGKGRVVALLGMNGAGKTTALKMILSHLIPRAGTCTIDDLIVQSNVQKANYKIGYCPQFDSYLMPNVTVKNHLTFFAEMFYGHPIRSSLLASFVEEICRSVELYEFINVKAKNLSGGNKRKLSTALTLIMNRSLIVLDECTTGVDPYSRHRIWETVSKLAQSRDTAVLMTTHYMEEATVADKIVIMKEGRAQAIGTEQSLKQKYGNGYRLELQLADSNQDSYALVCSIFNVDPEQARTFVHLNNCHDNRFMFQLLHLNGLSVAQVYESLLMMKQNGLQGFSFGQVTMEHVFLQIA